VEIKQAGEILIVTNVMLHYITKAVKEKILIANVMNLMSRHGIRKKLLNPNVEYKTY